MGRKTIGGRRVVRHLVTACTGAVADDCLPSASLWGSGARGRFPHPSPRCAMGGMGMVDQGKKPAGEGAGGGRGPSGRPGKDRPEQDRALPALFKPFRLRDLTVRNRVWMPPMDMYSVYRHDGIPTQFHYQHYVSRALGGFGVIITEATAVSPDGRISPCDVGIWNDEQARAWARIAEDMKASGTAPMVQLNHSGRKGSSGCSSMGHINATVPVQEGGWQPAGPSPIPYGHMDTPREMSVRDIHQVTDDFRSAARRAVQAGFTGIELHAAHGYLLSEFLDPLINKRGDEYGGDLSGRMRLLVEVTDAVRDVMPVGMPLLVRVSATDWAPGGWGLEETVEVARVLKLHGVDLIDVSTGGLVPGVSIPAKPGYQVPFATQVRNQALVPVTAVGLITRPKQADRIVRKNQADAVEIGRAALREPYWPLRAAYKLGMDREDIHYPEPYARGAYGISR